MGRKQTLLEHLTAAGEQGLSSLELVEIAGHRFSARLKELRGAGYEIERERIDGSAGNLSRYRLVALPNGEVPAAPAFPPGRLLSIRRAWPILSRLLAEAEDSPAARAQVCDLILRQPELVRSASVRHNLAAAKTRRLDSIAAAVLPADQLQD